MKSTPAPLRGRCFLLIAARAEDPAPADVEYSGVLKARRRRNRHRSPRIRVREEIPVGAGALTLLYPEWLPGNHSPRGPIDKLAGLAFTVDGQASDLVARLDQCYAFHLDVPEGATTLVAEFAYLSPQDSGQGRVVMTPDMLDLQWNSVILYPAGTPQVVSTSRPA